MININAILNFLLNSRCYLCNASAHQHDLCTDCYHDLPFFPIDNANFCPKCGEKSQNHELCDYCLTYQTDFDYTIPTFLYEFPLKSMIPEFKYAKNLVTGSILGHLMSDFINQYYKNHQDKCFPDLMIPLPLHDKKLKSRGFNQSLELARILKNRLKIPLYSDICVREVQTQVQASLNFEGRLKNVENAFKIVESKKNCVQNQRVVLVDDVMTTGTTLREVAKILKQAGAKEVVLWVIARALIQDDF